MKSTSALGHRNGIKNEPNNNRITYGGIYPIAAALKST